MWVKFLHIYTFLYDCLLLGLNHLLKISDLSCFRKKYFVISRIQISHKHTVHFSEKYLYSVEGGRKGGRGGDGVILVIYTEYVSPPLSVSYGHTKMEVQHYKRPSAESQRYQQ